MYYLKQNWTNEYLKVSEIHQVLNVFLLHLGKNGTY